MDANNNLKNATIISNIGEPYLMEDKLSPMQITLTSDQEGENGGLSYLKNYTNDLNLELCYAYNVSELEQARKQAEDYKG